MKKFTAIALIAALAVPSFASAQSAREVRDSRREVREAQRDLNQARRYGNRDNVRDARRDVREAREELREDWRDYRRANPNQYRQGRYQAPRGYTYRTLTPGYQLRPEYVGNRYWLNNPQQYRLPGVRAGQRYIRYGNDLVLINANTNRVIRVYRGFYY